MSRYAVVSLLIFFTATISLEPLTAKGLTAAEAPFVVISPTQTPRNLILRGNYLLADSLPGMARPKQKKALIPWQKIMKTTITAYSSSPDETDSTPNITSSGSYTRYGVVASNFLPIGTPIRMPKLFGDQIFIVEDRLNSRYNDRIDIWLPTKERALEFGLRVSEVQVF